MADYAAWLQDPAAVRVVIIEVGVLEGGLQQTRYLSTRPYVTSPTDSTPNRYYEPVVKTGIKFTEEIGIDGKGAFSFGEIEISNHDGSRDNWLNFIWDNQSIKAYIGDVRWQRSEFQMIFNGVIATMGCKSRDTLSLTMRDKLQRLNTPITDKKIGGTGTNKDEVVNLTFGEVHNLTPQATNPVTLEYGVHDGAIEDFIEVRDNDKPVTVSKALATGKFTLTRQSAGAITCSVQGDKGSGLYKNTISGLIQRIVKGYGQVDSRFTDDDLDLPNLAAFESAVTYPVGVYAEGRTNVLSLCEDLAASVDAQLVMSREGKLRLYQLKIGGEGTPVAIGPNQMGKDSLKIRSRPLVKAAVMLGFAKNWTVQENMVTNINESHKRLYEKEWLTATATSTVVQAAYKLNAAPVQVDTLLLRRQDAEAEAQRRLDIWSQQRTVFEFDGTSDLLASLQLGSAVTLTDNRFGLSAGKAGVVISLAPDWLTGRVAVGVLV